MGPRFVELVHHRTDADGNRPRSSDAVEQRLAGGDGGEDQRHAVGKRAFYMLDRAGPLDFGEWRVDDQ